MSMHDDLLNSEDDICSFQGDDVENMCFKGGCDAC